MSHVLSNEGDLVQKIDELIRDDMSEANTHVVIKNVPLEDMTNPLTPLGGFMMKGDSNNVFFKEITHKGGQMANTITVYTLPENE